MGSSNLPTITLFLSIEGGVVTAREFRGSRERAPVVVRTYEEIEAIGSKICEARGYEEAQLEFCFSSSIDFAGEYTTDAAVLELCRELRGG